MYVLTELGYVLICQVKEKEKKNSFENALVEKSESSTRNKKGLLVFSIHLNNYIFVQIHTLYANTHNF